MMRTLLAVFLFLATASHALARECPKLKAECPNTPCANTLTSENPGQVAQRHSDELNATIQASDDDNKRWSGNFDCGDFMLNIGSAMQQPNSAITSEKALLSVADKKQRLAFSKALACRAIAEMSVLQDKS